MTIDNTISNKTTKYGGILSRGILDIFGGGEGGRRNFPPKSKYEFSTFTMLIHLQSILAHPPHPGMSTCFISPCVAFSQPPFGVWVVVLSLAYMNVSWDLRKKRFTRRYGLEWNCDKIVAGLNCCCVRTVVEATHCRCNNWRWANIFNPERK